MPIEPRDLIDSKEAAIISVVSVLLISIILFAMISSDSSPTGVPKAEHPDKPSNLTKENVGNYAFECEKAIITHDRASKEDMKEIDFSLNNMRIEQNDSSWSVHLQYTVASQSEDSSVGDTRMTANYLINESTTVRAATMGEKVGPDPRGEGEAVKRCS